jgi:hypothetical protein
VRINLLCLSSSVRNNVASPKETKTRANKQETALKNKHTISSGERIPNCTQSTRRSGADEYVNLLPLIVVSAEDA